MEESDKGVKRVEEEEVEGRGGLEGGGGSSEDGHRRSRSCEDCGR